jgi:hypothetical protein
MFMIFIIMGHRITTFGGHPIFNAETEERVSYLNVAKNLHVL